MSYEIKSESANMLHVKADKENRVALLLHGYGGFKEEMLPLGQGLTNHGISSTIIDLPGHGMSDEVFNYGSFKRSVDQELANMPDDGIIVGHSLGALIASNKDRRSVLISPPLELYFGGEKRELLKVLRVRNVKEESYFSGLRSVLENIDIELKKVDSYLVYGEKDLRTVLDYAKKAKQSGARTQMIRSADHLSILESLDLPDVVGNWINGVDDE